MSKSNAAIASPRNDEPVTAQFNFREKGKVQPKGYKGLTIDADVTVTVKGKVKQIGSSWDNGATFTIEVAACEIEQPASAPVSLGSALDAADSKRKRVM
jgi:hypothetical protein